MPILSSSISATNQDMMSKIWINGDTIIYLSRAHCWKRRNCSVTSNFYFSHNVVISCLLLKRQNEYLWSKGLSHIYFVICKMLSILTCLKFYFPPKKTCFYINTTYKSFENSVGKREVTWN